MLDNLTIQKHVKDHFRWESNAQGPIKLRNPIGLCHKLDPQPLDEGPRPKSGKLRLNL
jgi:hypothetical protein